MISTGHVSPNELSNESPVQELMLALVLKWLDTIAGEGRSERARMEKEGRAEREQLRSALTNMNSAKQRVVDILSDEEYTPLPPGPTRSASAAATTATGKWTPIDGKGPRGNGKPHPASEGRQELGEDSQWYPSEGDSQ